MNTRDKDLRESQAHARDCWESNADAWTALSRAGYDVYRDWLNTPAFFAMLPEVEGLRGLDIGCGEGHNTRLLAQRGAWIAAMDVSRSFIRHAVGAGTSNIAYSIADAATLPFADGIFDFVCGFMSFMNVPEPECVLSEAYRVLKPGGFLQFSISHPCFDTPHRRNLHNDAGLTYAIEVGDYFRNLRGETTEWLFSAAPPEAKAGLPKFRTLRFTRTLSQWLNALVETGFWLERVEEPRPTDETVRLCPRVQDAQIVAYFLHIRARRHSEA